MEKTKRYYILYNNGELECMDGINGTFAHMVMKGVIKMIIDTKEQRVMLPVDNAFKWLTVCSYSAPDLIIESKQ